MDLSPPPSGKVCDSTALILKHQWPRIRKVLGHNELTLGQMLVSAKLVENLIQNRRPLPWLPLLQQPFNG